MLGFLGQNLKFGIRLLLAAESSCSHNATGLYLVSCPNMPLLFLLVLLLALSATNLNGLLSWMQSNCRIAIGPLSTPLSQALICGIRLPAGASKDWLLNWGLIHLFVVSGAHFLFLEHHLRSLVGRAYFFRYLFAPLLLLYALATGGGPPVFRSGLALILHSMSLHWGYRWSASQVVLLSGLLCFVLVLPEQYLSLQLSWAAALLLTVPCAPPFPNAKKATVLWWGLLPLLSGLTWSHPFAILSNLIITPLFQPLLFPMVWIDQVLMELTLHSWLKEYMSEFMAYSPAPFRSESQDHQFKWLYLFSLQLLSLFLQRRKHENSAVGYATLTRPP